MGTVKSSLVSSAGLFSLGVSTGLAILTFVYSTVVQVPLVYFLVQISEISSRSLLVLVEQSEHSFI